MSRNRRALELARRYASGGSVSEDDVYFGGSPIDRLKTELKHSPRVSEQQAAQNRKASGRAVLESLPVVGNVMAAGDAMDMGQAAIDDFKRGDYAGAFKKKVASKAFGLAALIGLPVGKTAANVVKGASSRAGVFVPATDDAAADTARELRSEGAKNSTVFKKTGKVFNPEGTLMEEIPDSGMEVRQALVQPGMQTDVGRLIKHPELFEQFPHLKNVPVQIAKQEPGGSPLMSSLTKRDGTFVFPAKENIRGDVAKLLQYQISDESKFAPAVRHSLHEIYSRLAGSAERAASAAPGGTGDIRALVSYLNMLQSGKGMVDDLVARGTPGKAEQAFGSVSAGNVLAKKASHRANAPAHQLAVYPFPDFERTLPLVSEKLAPEQVRQMLLDWRQFGAGRPPKFADGGRVQRQAAARGRRKLAVGAIAGVTPGRSDELPVKLPAGAYVIPADIVSALGEGNTAAGFKKLDARFPGGKRRLAKKNGGAVDAIVSDGEYVVTPEKVADLGNGDIDRGHGILDLFVKATRQAHIKRLQGIPDPNK